MLRFVQFLKENYNIFEAKESVVNRYKKHYADHPMAEEHPEKFHDVMRFAADHGESHDERLAVARWALDGHVRHTDDEDAPTVRMILGRHRGARAKNNIEKDHQISSYRDPSHALEHLNKVSPAVMKKKQFGRSPIEKQKLEEFSDHKLGTISTESHGDADVYHFHHDLHGEDRVEKAQKEFIKPGCGKKTPWCVVSEPDGEHYMKDYSKGQGFFYYTKKDTMEPVAAHGHEDGVRTMENTIHDESESIAKQTNKLLPVDSEHKVLHGVSHEGILSSQEMMRAVDSYGEENRDVISMGIRNKDKSVVDYTLNHPAIDKDHFYTALQNFHVPHIEKVLNHPEASLNIYLKASSHGNSLVSSAGTNALVGHLEKYGEGFNHHRPEDLSWASLSPYADKYNVDTNVIRRAVVHSAIKNRDTKHLKAMLDHGRHIHPETINRSVSDAIYHDKPEHLKAILDHDKTKSGMVQVIASDAMHHDKPEYLKTILDHNKADSDVLRRVEYYAVHHDRPEHLKIIKNHPKYQQDS